MGTNENTNGMLRQHFLKGWWLSRHSADDLARRRLLPRATTTAPQDVRLEKPRLMPSMSIYPNSIAATMTLSRKEPPIYQVLCMPKSSLANHLGKIGTV